MTDERREENTCPVVFSSIATDNGMLYGVVGQGNDVQLYPLFVFNPLEQAYVNGEYVHFAPYWSKYMHDTLMSYIPVKYINLGEPYSANNRGADPVRPWLQLMYRGWPLYFLAAGETLGPQASYLTMFMPAAQELTPPYDKKHGDRVGDGGPPGPNLGP